MLVQITEVSCTGYGSTPPEEGPMQCLADGAADVAFVSLTNLNKATDSAGLSQVRMFAFLEVHQAGFETWNRLCHQS
jgi:hypothetical protein